MRLLREIKYWYQRRTRGFGDDDLWDLDTHLAKLMLPRLKAFRDMDHCCDRTPIENKLDCAILALELIADPSHCEKYKDPNWLVVINNHKTIGLHYLADIFETLWD